jgi:hypothetical protein
VTAAREPVVLCAATYDQPLTRNRSDTHTCDLPSGHAGALHHCETCDCYWLARVQVSPVAPLDREQIARARMDAYLHGTGFLMVQHSDDGQLHYVRLQPAQVTIGAGPPNPRAEDRLLDELAQLVGSAENDRADRRGWVRVAAIRDAVRAAGTETDEETDDSETDEETGD